MHRRNRRRYIRDSMRSEDTETRNYQGGEKSKILFEAMSMSMSMSCPSSSSPEAEAEAEAEAPLIPPLPKDDALNCLARIPRSHHPNLSLVSKPIRAILSSPDFFATRSLQNCTQPLLYLTLRTDPGVQEWFALHRTPSPLLAPLPPIPSPAVGSAYAVLGPTIYVLGGSDGSVNDVPSPHVWILDCRLHRWRQGPSMGVARKFAVAGVLDGKIYVLGGCVADNWAEVLDPAAERWEGVPSPARVREKWMNASAVIGGKVYATSDISSVAYEPRSVAYEPRSGAYEPRSGAWESVGGELDRGWRVTSSCVVEGILYCYDYLEGEIKGFDVERGVWEELKGLEKVWEELKRLEKRLARFLRGATMADLGGKLCVVWEGLVSGNELEIWCAEIQVKKNPNGELWGQLDWSGKLLSVPAGSIILHCSSVAV